MMLLSALLLSFLVGSIPSGVILASYFTEVNIREGGSGNIGATNVYRLTGRALGVATLAADALKGASMALLGDGLYPAEPRLAGAVAFAAFIGHCYSIYLSFRGGKGVATAAGIYLVFTPVALLVAAAVWVLAVLWWKRSSVGALAAAALLPLLIAFFPSYRPHLGLTLALVGVLAWRHRENIERLIQGSEPPTTSLPGEPG